jgi:serine phosphatase RsbU (regulator of sigma subunit)
MSDGIIEASSPQGEAFGMARVTGVLATLRPVQETLSALETTLRAFTVGAQGDDEALIGVEV